MPKPLLTGGNGKSNEFNGTAAGQVPKWDGVDSWALALIPYDLPVEVPGTPSINTRIVNFKAVRPFRLASSGHQGGCAVANPSTNTSFTVQKNLSGTDTITFQSGGGFASSVTQTDFAIGDLLTVETPGALNSMDTPFFTLAMTLL